jgi:tRNA uridine 5-carbamoylmethylation protein Kti12
MTSSNPPLVETMGSSPVSVEASIPTPRTSQVIRELQQENEQLRASMDEIKKELLKAKSERAAVPVDAEQQIQQLVSFSRQQVEANQKLAGQAKQYQEAVLKCAT